VNLPEGATVRSADGAYGFTVSYVGGTGNDVVLTAMIVNSPPTANAGGPYAVTYGGSLTLNASGSSDPDGDPLTYSWTINGSAAATGVQPTLTWSALGLVPGQSYTVAVTANDGHGHAVTSPAVALTVGKATLTVTVDADPTTAAADAFTKFYGQANPAFGVRYAGFVNGDLAAGLGGSLSFATAAAAASPVGSYSVTASGLTSGNYSITYQAGTLTVNKAMLTVTADNQARIYSYANPSFIAGYTGFQNGETLATSGVTGVPALATPATSTSPVGSYPIATALGSLAAGNYAFAFADGTLTVNKASTTTTVSVSAATPLFGVDGVTLSATVFSSAPTISTGTVTFYDGTTLLGTVSVAGGSASLALGATSLSPGSHTIRAVYSGDGNFLGSDSTAALTVLARVDLSGRVFDDRNNDGLFNGTDAGLAGVSLTLLNASNVAVATATTGGDGKYTFTGTFAAGTYRIVASQPDGFLDGKETAGTLGGTVDNTRDWDAIDGIVLHAGDVGTGYNFAEIRPSRIQSLVWVDENDDGEVNFGEKAIAGVAVTLTGTDDRGHAVSLSLTTDAQGIVEFVNLRPGSYTLVETQPSGYLDGKDTLGTVNGITTGNASMND